MGLRISILVLLFLMSCSPLTVLDIGYMAFVERGRKVEWQKCETTNEVDSFICAKTQLTLFSEELIGKKYPYFEFTNGDVSVYVQKEFICEKPSGKIVWKTYK